MPSLVYDHAQYISKDTIQCKKCLVMIHRNAPHEFKWCSCRTVGIENDRYVAIDGKQKVWLIEKMVGSPPTSLVNICR